jgi:hypothetical protein
MPSATGRALPGFTVRGLDDVLARTMLTAVTTTAGRSRIMTTWRALGSRWSVSRPE